MAAAKEIRFAKLIEKSGEPEVVTVWADPKKDRAFMELVKKGRILTVIQKPTGNKKDFGLIGFHPQPFAAYMSFPKPLKNGQDLIVIGIKYDLLSKSEAGVVGSVKAPRPPKPAKPAPVRKMFEVTIRRRGSLEVKINLEAFGAIEAKKQALSEISSQEFSLPAGETQNNVVSVTED